MLQAEVRRLRVRQRILFGIVVLQGLHSAGIIDGQTVELLKSFVLF